jgi:hypothetical protein
MTRKYRFTVPHGPALARVYLDYRAAADAADRPGQFDLVRRGTGVEECARVDRYAASSSHCGRPNARSETCDDDGSDKTVAQAQVDLNVTAASMPPRSGMYRRDLLV